MVKLYSKEYELFLSSQCNKVKLEFDVEADFVYTEGEYHILVLLKEDDDEWVLEGEIRKFLSNRNKPEGELLYIEPYVEFLDFHYEDEYNERIKTEKITDERKWLTPYEFESIFCTIMFEKPTMKKCGSEYVITNVSPKYNVDDNFMEGRMRIHSVVFELGDKLLNTFTVDNVKRSLFIDISKALKFNIKDYRKIYEEMEEE